MKSIAPAALAALLACGPSRVARPPAPPPPRPAAVDAAALDGWLDRELAPHLPAVVAGVLVDGELVWHRAAGSRDGRGGPPPDRRSMFRIGSVTKVFTAIAVMRLRARGVLDLDAPIGRWVPELADRLPGVTLRHLVTHTSGVPSVGDGSAPYWSQTPPTEAQLLRALDTPVEFPPGTRSVYSNAGMALAGLVAARAARRPYRELLAAEVLAPLGVSPVWDRDAAPAERRVAGRGDDGSVDPPTWQLGAFEPAGGLWASLDDLAALARFALGRPGADAVLDAASRKQMVSPDALPGEHGVAWVVTGEGFGHSGSTTDYSATVVGSADGRTAAMVLASGGAVDLTDCAAALLARAVVRREPPASCARFAPVAVDRAAMGAALDRLLAFLDAPDEAGARATFAPSFLAAIPPATLIAKTGEIRTLAGRCTAHELRSVGSAGGAAALVCAKGKLAITFHLEGEPPHRFDMLQASGLE